MSYTTVENVLVMVPAINSITNLTSASLASYVTRADNLINAKLANRYSLPLSGTFPILKDIATDLTIYEVVGKRNMTLSTKDKENSWPSRFKDALKILDAIASGAMPLLSSSLAMLTPSVDGASPAWSNTSDYLQTMHEGSFHEMGQDSDKIEGLHDERD